MATDVVKNKELRNQNFRLGQIHGKLQAENSSSEAHIQRTVFLSQKLCLWKKRDEAIVIRIFGYEVPLKTKCTRGECIDLIGYDKNHNLYLIELKKMKSGEHMARIIEQINDYADTVTNILPYIEREFAEQYFLPINFAGIQKLILAPREFYNSLRKKESLDHTIEYAYFRDRDITKRKPGEMINIHLVRK